MNSIPSASCPVAKHVTSAATNPPTLVHAIDSNVDVLAFVTRGLRRFVRLDAILGMAVEVRAEEAR